MKAKEREEGMEERKWGQITSAEEMDAFLDKKIRENRVHNFSFQLTDKEGKAQKGCRVQVIHQDHDFTFGVCPNGHISMTNKLACGEGKEAESYWERIDGLFNAATLWWGWRVLEPQRGKHTFLEEVDGFGPMERMVSRAENLGLKLTAHAILYPRQDVSPQWLSSCTKQDAIKALEDHIRITAERYGNRISCWHPVNEAYEQIQQVGGLCVEEGLVYRLLGDLLPNAVLVDNGGYTIDPDFYEKGIKSAEKFGSRVDALGIRGYFELYNANALAFYQSIWEHFSNLKDRYQRAVRFTEIGASWAPRKGSYSPWDVDKTTAKQLGIADFSEYRDNQPITEETQAQFLVRMYKLAFAHPDVQECTYWDLCDSYTWNQVEGGLLRGDLSPKPAYWKLKELIHEQWHTQTEIQSDETGTCRFEGFDGTYKVKIGENVYPLHFSKEDAQHTLCL